VNSILVETIVIILTAWAATVWLLTRATQRQQRAWQWWQQQQQQQLHHRAESIRDDLLQQTFAFRRYLEKGRDPIPSQTITPDPSVQWLERLNQVYCSLESLSNELSPPFVEDSLPLALQFVLKDLEKAYPNLWVDLQLPLNWTSFASNPNAMLVSVVMVLLHLLRPGKTASALQATLSQTPVSLHSPRFWQMPIQKLRDILSQPNGFQLQNQLTLKLEEVDPAMIQSMLQSTEIQHLQEIFNGLLAGKLEIQQDGRTVFCQLSWPQ
jgi:hypothetical protein